MSCEIRNQIEDIVEPEPAFTNKTKINDSIDPKKKNYMCEICGIRVTSSNVLQRHQEGRRHLMKVEREGKTFECELCDIAANSQIQLDSHLRSTKHKHRLYRKEHPHETMHKGAWIIIFCITFMFFNFLLLFKKLF